MDDLLRERCLKIAGYMLDHRATLRETAKVCGLSKSAVHKEMRRTLPKVDAALAREVGALMDYHKAVRHLRGGEATRLRFLQK